MKPTTIALSALAGAALFEAALIPGIAIGAVAVLAPRVPKALGKWRSRRRNQKAAVARIKPPATTEAPALPQGELRRVVFKTITFRTIVTSLDFTSNYLVIGNLASAAGLSAFSLVAGPFFFFLHEILWRKYGPAEANAEIAVPALSSRGSFQVKRPLAKTITYRACATTSDFSVNYFVVGDLATAAGLTAFGFIVGPFVYYYHEKAWDRFSPQREGAGLAKISPRPGAAVHA